MTEQLEPGDLVEHDGEEVEGTVVDLGYTGAKFKVAWHDEDGFDTTLESLHSVQLLEKGGGRDELVDEHGRWQAP